MNLAKYILHDLIKEGYSKEELIDEFNIRSKKLDIAYNNILKDASDAAQGKGEFYSFDDVFSEEDK